MIEVFFDSVHYENVNNLDLLEKKNEIEKFQYFKVNNSDEYLHINDLKDINEHDLKTINFIGENTLLAVREGVDVLTRATTYINEHIDLYCEEVNRNSNSNSQNTLLELAVVIEDFISIMILVKSHLSLSEELLSKKEDFKSFELKLLENLKNILTARENNDVILLCDLLQYELKDSLLKWKDSVLTPTIHIISKITLVRN